MPLPTGHHAQETKELQALYDEYCKIAFREQLSHYFSPEHPSSDMSAVISAIASNSHQFATAMMNERKKCE